MSRDPKYTESLIRRALKRVADLPPDVESRFFNHLKTKDTLDSLKADVKEQMLLTEQGKWKYERSYYNGAMTSLEIVLTLIEDYQENL